MHPLFQVTQHISPELYQRLTSAVETGKWPNGQALTPSQREYAQQWIILLQSRNSETRQQSNMSIERDVVTGKEAIIKTVFMSGGK